MIIFTSIEQVKGMEMKCHLLAILSLQTCSLEHKRIFFFVHIMKVIVIQNNIRPH